MARGRKSPLVFQLPPAMERAGPSLQLVHEVRGQGHGEDTRPNRLILAI